MGVKIIFGGQFGSEGKGKSVKEFAHNGDAIVRVGGTNSGHTVVEDGLKRVYRVLPASVNSYNEQTAVISAGSYIDLDILKKEMKTKGLPDNKLKINPNAVIITEDEKFAEKAAHMNDSIGSTESGTGMAVISRIKRDNKVRLARDVKELDKYVCDTTDFLRGELDKGRNVVIEGTQGFGLSLLHAKEYPYATSRDTSAAAFLSEAGLSPFDVTDVIMVLRSYPIRVAGNSGPLPREITWAEVAKDAMTDEDLTEYTSVTKRIRRVARFDADVVQRAIKYNKPTTVVLNHCDYFDYKIHDTVYLSEIAKRKIHDVEYMIRRGIDYIGTGDYVMFPISYVR